MPVRSHSRAGAACAISTGSTTQPGPAAPSKRWNNLMALFLAYDPSTNPLNTNEWAFPVCEVLHIIGFAVAIGTITMVDLRLLGIGMKKQSAADLVKDTGAWTLAGLALVLISGPLIFSSDPNLYLHNISFRFKITM